MNTPQRIALTFGLFAAAGMVLVPPWHQQLPNGERVHSSGYAPLFDPPLRRDSESSRRIHVPVISWGRLLAQGLAVVLVTGAAFVILGGDEKGPKPEH